MVLEIPWTFLQLGGGFQQWGRVRRQRVLTPPASAPREQKQLPAVRAQIRSVCALCAHPDSRKLAASGTDAQPPAPRPQVGMGGCYCARAGAGQD